MEPSAPFGSGLTDCAPALPVEAMDTGRATMST